MQELQNSSVNGIAAGLENFVIASQSLYMLIEIMLSKKRKRIRNVLPLPPSYTKVLQVDTNVLSKTRFNLLRDCNTARMQLLISMHETGEVSMFYHSCAQCTILNIAIVSIKILFASLSASRYQLLHMIWIWTR